MGPSSPAYPHPWPTLFQLLGQMGIFSVFFILIALLLTAWLTLLFLRVRPLGEHLAYIAATLYPFVLGFLGASLSAVHVMYELGNNGIANPVLSPALLAGAIGELLLRLIFGSALTCLFLPLGVLALLIRLP
jgi:hypothetical protein